MLELTFASILWAFSFGLIKTRLAGVDPDFIAFVRLALSALVFAPWLGGRSRVGPRRRGALLVLGAVQFGAMYALYIRAYPLLAAHEIALATVTTPLWVALFALGRVKERGRLVLAALVAAAAGAALVMRRPSGALEGLLLVQGSNACFALGLVVYARYGGRAEHARDHAWMFLGAAVLSGAVWLGRGAPTPARLAPESLATLVYLGVVAAGVGFWAFDRGATRVAPGRLAVMNNLKIPLAVVVSVVVFGESIAPERLALAAGLFVLALWVSSSRRGNGTPGSG